MSLTLRQVQIFLAVAQSDSISDAGAILGITKSAVSQAITDLETRLGVNLFERSKGRAVLSAEGRAFKSTADELVRRADDAEHFFQHPSHAQLKLDVTLSIGAFFIADLFRDFYASANWLPEVEVTNTSNVAMHLGNFSADIALVEGPIFDLDLITEPWMTDELVVVAPRGHRLTNEVVSWEKLSEENWILREPGSSTRIFFNAQLSQRLYCPKIVATVNSFEAIIGMVMNGMGLTFMTNRVLSDPFFGPRLERVRLPEQFERQLSFCRHREKYISRDMEQLMSFCRRRVPSRLEHEARQGARNESIRYY